MKRLLLLLLTTVLVFSLKAQFTVNYENSFRNWQAGQGWVTIDNDAISTSVGKVTRSVTTGVPPTTEIMDYMLGVKSLTGNASKVFMTPALTLGANPWAQFYSYRTAGLNFSLWVVTNPNNTTLSGLTDSLSMLNTNGFNNVDLALYANSTIRLAFKIQGSNPTAYIDDFKVFDKLHLGYIPDAEFRAYLQSVVPTAFIGDSLDYTHSAVTNLRRINHTNGSIQSLEGMHYFPFLKKITLSYNAINYFPLNRLPYIDTLIVDHNNITAIPDIPMATYIDYDFNLVTNIPDFYNNYCTFLHANNNLIYDCLPGTNRFVNGRLLNNIAINKGSYIYYNLQYSGASGVPVPPCSQTSGSIEGVVYFDFNTNGVYDLGDVLFEQQPIQFAQTTDIVTDQNGHYGVMLDSGLVDMDVVAIPPYLDCVNPLNTTIDPDELIQHDFRLVATGSHKDVEILLSSPDQHYPNAFPVNIVALNHGTNTEQPMVKIPLDPTMTYSFAQGTPIGDTLYWSPTIAPFSSASTFIMVTVPANFVQQNVITHAIVVLPGDEVASNNNAVCSTFIIPFEDLPLLNPPHDPNNKIVSTPVVDTNFMDYLYYTINFENTGAGNASYVSISDRLPTKLDPTTVQFLGSSHPCSMSYGLDSLLRFTFYPIVLTPTSIDSLHSKGWVYFRIKPKTPMQLGDTIKNRAGIIFDTQPTIYTEYSYVWVDPLKDANFQSLDGVSVCTHDTVTFQDLSSGTPSVWEWQFEGGTPAISHEKNPSVIYNQQGTYDVKLITQWLNGHSDTLLIPDYISVGTPVSMVPIAPVCGNDVPFELSGGLPVNGSYYIDLIAEDTLNPVQLAAGVHSIDYVYTNLGGCSDTAHSTLLINQHYTSQVQQSVCQGESYSWQGGTYTQAGIYQANYSTVSGCDSNYVLTLNVLPQFAVSETQTICSGETVNWQGTTYDQPGTYQAVYSALNGCDSIHTLVLNVLPEYAFADIQTLCYGENYHWQGSDYTESGNYQVVYTAMNGCDSIHHLTLNVLPQYTFTDAQTICSGEIYHWQGNDYTESGTYQASYSTILGCDSIHQLTLTVLPQYSFNETQDICTGEIYHWQGNDYTESGTFQVAYQTIEGCDSVFHLILNVQAVNASVSQQPELLMANPENAVYQWLNCENGFLTIPGETAQSFTPDSSGVYAVIVTENGCSDTSDCVTFSAVTLQEIIDDQLEIMPNPVSDLLNIQWNGAGEVRFDILNEMGQIVSSGTVKEKMIVHTDGFADGIYFLKAYAGKEILHRRIVKCH